MADCSTFVSCSFRFIGKELFCRLLLKILLNKEFEKLVVVPQKTYNGADTTLHGARLDVYLEETPESKEKESATIYDVEPDQNNKPASIQALPKRVRYYHAIIDTNSLSSGTDYTSLKNVVVIMILPFDPFGYGQMIYTVKNQISELPKAPYEDGAKTIFFYTKGESENISDSIRQLLQYFEDTRPENATNEELLKMQQMVDTIKENKEMNKQYMKIFEREKMLVDYGIDQGISQGISQGIIQNTLDIIQKHLDLGHSIETISDALLIPVTEVQKLICSLSQSKTSE